MQRKTILQIEVTNKEFDIKYNGSIAETPTTKEAFKHDGRLIKMLASDKRVFDFFFRIVEPARRFYMREAKRKLKAQKNSK